MIEAFEDKYRAVQKWGFKPVHCIALSSGIALLVTGVYAASVSDGWPTCTASHLALAHLGLIHASKSYHPVWGWCARLFGLHSAYLSVISAGLSIGFLVFCLSRVRDIITGLLVGLLLMVSPWMHASGTNVSFSSFDLLLMLGAVAFVPIRNEPGAWWRVPVAVILFCLFVFDVLHAAMGCPSELLFDGLLLNASIAAVLGWAVTSALESSRPWIGYCWLAVAGSVTVVMLLLGVLSSVSGYGRLAHNIAGIILDKSGSCVKWMVTDAYLEDALVYREALKGGGPHIVCLSHDHDAGYLTNLENTVASEYPGVARLRLAAKLGVLPFLEELPFVETNMEAIISVWSPRIWDEKSRDIVSGMIGAGDDVRCDPQSRYVALRLAAMTDPNRKSSQGAAAHALALRLGNWYCANDGDTNHTVLVNEAIGKVLEDIRCGDMDKLMGHARRLVREDRTNPLGNVLLGTMAAEEGDDEVAVVCLERAVGRGDVPVLVWNDYAEALRRVGRFDEAERAIRHAVSMSHDEWRLYETWADICFSSGKPIGQVEEILSKAELLSSQTSDRQKPTLVFLRMAVLWQKGDQMKSRVLLHQLNTMTTTAYLKERIRIFRAAVAHR